MGEKKAVHSLGGGAGSAGSDLSPSKIMEHYLMRIMLITDALCYLRAGRLRSIMPAGVPL
jgi:hypothetical protein